MELRILEKILLLGSMPIQTEEMSSQFAKLVHDYKDPPDLVLKKAAEHQVLPSLAFNVLNVAKEAPFCQQVGDFLTHLLEAYRIVNGVMIEHLKYLVTELSPHIQMLCIKGTDTLLNYYPDIGARALGDIDLLIGITDVSLFKMLAQKIGYCQARLNKATSMMEPFNEQQIKEVERIHYELLGFTKLVDIPELLPYKDIFPILETGSLYPRFLVEDGSVKYVVCFDVHHNIAPDINAFELWNRTRRFKWSTMTLTGQSLEDLLWVLTARLYHETMMLSKQSLKMFNDIAAILIKDSRIIDWGYFTECVVRNDLQPSIFYVFSHMKRLFRTNIPDHLLAEFNPENPSVLRNHDWGDFFPKILGRAEIINCELLESATPNGQNK